MGSLEFSFADCANLLCSSLCLLHAILELHVMDEKMVNDFLIGK